MFDHTEEYSMIPEETLKAIDDWVISGKDPGDFLFGMLSGDLDKACAHADGTHRLLIFYINKYCYNEIPRSCYGSLDKIKGWREWLQLASGKEWVASLTRA